MNVLVGVVVVVLVLLAVVLVVTGALGLAGTLPGNDVLGVRTPETRRHPDAWRVANKAAGPAAIGAGAMLALGALGATLVGGWVGAIVVALGIVTTVVLLNTAGLAGSRAAAMWQAAVDDEHDAGDGCCSSGDATTSADSGTDPAKDCGVSGGCGSCALQGMCETDTTATIG